MDEADRKIARYGKSVAKAGEGEALGELLLEAAELNRRLGGCLQYDVYRSVFDPDAIWVTELWESQAELDATLANDQVRALIERARPLIADMEVTELIPLGGLGDRLARDSKAVVPESAAPASGYSLITLEEVEDVAAKRGATEIMEARFLGGGLGANQAGAAHFRMKPGMRQPFGHSHDRVEEIYFVISGSGRVKIEDEVLDLVAKNVLRIGPALTRSFEAGPDGIEILVFGQKAEGDGTMKQDWWTD